MKNTLNSIGAVKNLQVFFSTLTDNEILSVQALNCVRGGGEGDGIVIDPILFPPKDHK